MEAAGTAAALYVKTGSKVRDLDIKLLQKVLVEQNCKIGQSKKKITPRRARSNFPVP
jgi:hypothetical protein